MAARDQVGLGVGKAQRGAARSSEICKTRRASRVRKRSEGRERRDLVQLKRRRGEKGKNVFPQDLALYQGRKEGREDENGRCGRKKRSKEEKGRKEAKASQGKGKENGFSSNEVGATETRLKIIIFWDSTPVAAASRNAPSASCIAGSEPNSWKRPGSALAARRRRPQKDTNWNQANWLGKSLTKPLSRLWQPQKSGPLGQSTAAGKKGKQEAEGSGADLSKPLTANCRKATQLITTSRSVDASTHHRGQSGHSQPETVLVWIVRSPLSPCCQELPARP